MSFFDAGGDSLHAQRLVAAIEDRLGLPVHVRDVVESPSVAALARRLATPVNARASSQASGAAMAAAVALPPGIAGSGQRSRHVLLTGATGFVGSHLLYELLGDRDVDITCLVRANSLEEGKRQLQRALEYQKLDGRTSIAPQIVVGDLRLPQLGIGGRDYERLAASVDTVVHAGALVNLLLDYDAHRATNVDGTVEVFRFAPSGGPTHVHLISTLSACSAVDTTVQERPPANQPPRASGYAQSKWAAERLSEQAAARSIPIAVYRLGEVMPHSSIRVANPRGMVDLVFAACLRLGVTFPTAGAVIDYTPVDDIAAAVAHAVRQQETGWFHLLHPRSLAFDELFRAFRERAGLRQVSYRTFQSLLRDAVLATADPQLVRTLAVLPPCDHGMSDEDLAAGFGRMFRDGTQHFATFRGDRLVAEARRSWRQIDKVAVVQAASSAIAQATA